MPFALAYRRLAHDGVRDSGQLMMNFSLFIYFLLRVTRHKRASDPDRFVTFVQKANAYKLEDVFITIVIQQIGMRALSHPPSTGVRWRRSVPYYFRQHCV